MALTNNVAVTAKLSSLEGVGGSVAPTVLGVGGLWSRGLTPWAGVSRAYGAGLLGKFIGTSGDGWVDRFSRACWVEQWVGLRRWSDCKPAPLETKGAAPGGGGSEKSPDVRTALEQNDGNARE